ncbi:MAG: four helix bundle protein [Acidobacteria bacterium]|nr:four helix bundle protein [Acidobacteriota bacterium]
MAETYRDLVAWQRAMALVVQIYRATQAFPTEERYGLTSQLRRAAVSIPSNIAEGKGRYSSGDTIHFMVQARGSLLEVETQVLIARTLGYLSDQDAEGLLQQTAELGRILNGLISAFRKRASRSDT